MTSLRLPPRYEAKWRLGQGGGGEVWAVRDRVTDRTLALKVFAGRHQTRAYPSVQELHDFGRRVCGVSQPAQVLETIAQSMHQTLEDAKGDARVPAALLAKMQAAWETGLMYVR